ncbi:hypothetical protein [Nocardioides sp.]|uniref:hypothetical protein n=1 Tax=Nocardioides sp. TaxID=35761 RepID=UPI003513459A
MTFALRLPTVLDTLARAHQARAVDNAREAATTAARRRLEHAEVALWLARHGAERTGERRGVESTVTGRRTHPRTGERRAH